MDSIKKLTSFFNKFPTVGSRTAGRFALHIIKSSPEQVQELIDAIKEVKQTVTLCAFCFNPHENQSALCAICRDTTRKFQQLCIVEKEADLQPIENTRRYKGIYFIVNNQTRLQALQERVKDSTKHGMPKIDFTEIIIAINPTPEGKLLSILVEKALREINQSPTPFKITHLAQGLPVGGELEYADEETLESAFEGRK